MAEETSKEEIKNLIDKYKPSKEAKADLKLVFDRYEEMKSGNERQEMEDHWDNAEKLMEGDTGETRDEDDWRANICFNIVAPALYGALQEIIEAPPVFNATPGGKDDIDKIPIINVVLKYTLYASDYLSELVKTFYDAIQYGVAVTQVYYKEDPRLVSDLVKFDDEKGIEEYKEREINDKKIVDELVSIRNFFWDEMADSLENSRDCIRRYVINIDEFKRAYSRYKWAKNVDYVVAGGDTSMYEYYDVPEDVTGDQVEVLWYWSRAKDKLIIKANNVLIRSTPNPNMHKELPFARYVGIVKPHYFCGRGFPELVKDTQEELNTYRNMMIDQAKLNIYKTFLVSTRLNLEDEDLVPSPSGHIPVDNEQGESVEKYIKPLEYGGLKPEAFTIVEKLEDNAKRQTGIDDRLQSVQTGGTATEQAILKESSLKRIRLILKVNQWGALTRAGRLRLALIQQFFTQKRVEKVIGEKGEISYEEKNMSVPLEGVEIKVENEVPRVVRIDGYSVWEVKPDLIRNNCDIRIDIDPMLYISKPLQQTKINEAVQVLNMMFPEFIDREKLFEHYMRIQELPPDIKISNQESMFPDMIKLAELENEEMVKGNPVPPTEGATPEHTQTHIKFAEQEGETFSEKIKKMFTYHVVEEAKRADLQDRMTPKEIPGGIPPPMPGQGQPEGMPQPGPNQQAIMGRPGAPNVPATSMSKQNVGRPPMSAREVVPARNTGQVGPR